MRLTRALEVYYPSRVATAVARGVLELVWDVAYENGEDFLGSVEDVELAASWADPPGALCTMLVSAGFIDRIESGYAVHDLFDHAPDYVKKRLVRETERRARGKELRRRHTSPAGGGEPPVAGTNGEQPSPLGEGYPEWLPVPTWQTYLVMREEKQQRPMSAAAQKVAMANLGKWRAEGQDVQAILDYSIVGGYPGLFSQKGRRGTIAQREPTTAEMDAALAREHWMRRP